MAAQVVAFTSSISSTLAERSSALAMQINCRCPTDRFPPPSDTGASIPPARSYVVRGANMGYGIWDMGYGIWLAGGNSSWCPELKSRTTHCPIQQPDLSEHPPKL